ncbi:MAG: SDR family NAD(P)-dependent oxidoreductase [Kiritimatiellae bacterium]|nr:SDR family NAD(P)-dependent oxidoreductase [Kiritimatiellia bacterium]
MKTVLITGGSSGIGEAFAYKLASTGVEQLFICGTNLERLEMVRERCITLGAKAVSVKQLDVTNREATAEWISSCNAESPLDLVYANAGVATGAEFVSSNVYRTFDINVGGVINAVLPAIECFLAREKVDSATGFRGQIAITASMAGYHGLPQCPSYSASKSCVKAWGAGLRGMLAKKDIGVSVICPGFVRSRITDVNTCPMPFFMEADKAADKIYRGIKRNKGIIAFPWQMRFVCWFMGTLPEWLSGWIYSKLPEKNDTTKALNNL